MTIQELESQLLSLDHSEKLRVIELLQQSLVSQESRSGQAAVEILRELAAMDACDEIDDPIAWQQSIRIDRPLPGRSV
jgi:hypothetical protein